MLQPVLVRPLFRVLLVPIALAVLAVGVGALFGTVVLLRERFWIGGLFAFTGLGFGALGVLGLILAATGALPEWVVGDGSEDEDLPVAP